MPDWHALAEVKTRLGAYTSNYPYHGDMAKKSPGKKSPQSPRTPRAGRTGAAKAGGGNFGGKTARGKGGARRRFTRPPAQRTKRPKEDFTAIIAQLEEAFAPLLKEFDLLAESIHVGRAGGQRTVRVTVDLIDGPGGVSSDTLADASRAMSAYLDDKDPIGGAYVLEVSTPGLPRPLTEPRHFRRCVNRTIEVTRESGTVTGQLRQCAGDVLTIETPDGEQTIHLRDITGARAIADLSAR